MSQDVFLTKKHRSCRELVRQKADNGQFIVKTLLKMFSESWAVRRTERKIHGEETRKEKKKEKEKEEKEERGENSKGV